MVASGVRCGQPLWTVFLAQRRGWSPVEKEAKCLLPGGFGSVSSHKNQELLGSNLCCAFMFGKVCACVCVQLPALEGHRKDWGSQTFQTLNFTELPSVCYPSTICLLLLLIIEGICMKIGFPLSFRAQLPAAISHLKL